MSQNILISVLTVIFYITSLLGGGSDSDISQKNSLLPNMPSNSQTSSVAGQQGKIVGDRVTVRLGPGTEHSAVTTLTKDTAITLVSAENGWYQIRPDNGRTGWVPGYLVDIVMTTPRQASPSGKTVMGYYMLGSQSWNSLLQNSSSLTSVAPWSWGLDSYGGLTSDFDSNAFADVLQFAGNQQLDTYALIHNFFNGSFDARVVSALLNNNHAQNRAISQIHTSLKEWGMSGINLDFENVPAKDRDALTAFVAKLAETLHADGLKVTIAVPAKTADNKTNDFSGAFDYKALGNHVDQLVIMAYDQHWRGGPPGPVASVQWIEKVVQYATSQTSANQIVLGIPNYGYNWPSSGTAKSLTYTQTMELAAKQGVSVRWHSAHKAPHFQYGNGNQVWFENRYSIKYKIDLVNKYDLGGIALWRLGQEDPGIWRVIEDTLK